MIHPHIFVGGAEKAILYLVHHLNQLGHEAAICTLSTELDELPSIAQSLLYLTPEKPTLPRRLDSVYAAFQSVMAEVRVLRHLVRSHLDIFDVLIPCNFPAYWSTYTNNDSKPILWMSSEVFGPYNTSRDTYDKSRIFRFAFKLAASLDRYIVRRSVDEIATCSELNRQLIKERYGLDAEAIPTGVDYDFFSKNCPDAKEKLGLESCHVLLHVGSLVKRKNQSLSIRALHRLKSKVPDAKLIITGKGPWEPTLKQEVRELRLDADVLFTGSVLEEKLRILYHACDLNLFPAEDQTFGLVPFEAFAAGKPSLVSKNSGAGLLMAKQGFGYLVEPDVDSIVEAALNIFQNLGEAEEHTQRGRAYVQHNLTWKRFATEIAELCEDLCQ